MSDRQVFIVSAVRSPTGAYKGALSSLRAHEIGSIVIKEALIRAKVQPEEVSEVIMGQAVTAGQGQNPARQASVGAGIPVNVPAYLVNMLCGSGIKTVYLGTQSIMNLDSDIVVCGGQEVMSQGHHTIFMRQGTNGHQQLTDSVVHDVLTDAFVGVLMGNTAENVAKKYEISRKDQDKFAAECQQRVEHAQKAGYFVKEIVPITVNSKKGSIVVDTDEPPRHGTTVEALQRLKPAFQKDGSGTVTAGNSSTYGDAAAAVVLMGGDVVKSRGVSPIARVVAFSQVGVDPAYMGMGPVAAVTSALKKAGWNKEDVDLFEFNEAFAAQSVAVVRELDINPNKVNICGGAIALGHPIAASGTRILVTLLHALERTGGQRGVASLCVGGGMGVAMCVERC
ncbi:acetyl-CoA acetyltransferase, cytosolic isoform X2 [Zootermopsis nevadensis]|uniref:Acetyl-CoA acetyltransferase, cytosolic n=1 Tax=Zootermopsis nevadensis TaxID=136037 RepID=A0A067QS90_ZOONE|nr:acetyl-CoA acetyltransferase, cytosolic isoform X2 [Zootermopsis nevadensis]KDR12729.1 Acetyl-CoA acetyltransferase, cytosolic [Zootermopsis nevadensis]